MSSSLWLARPSSAQETQLINPGAMAVTGFSGVDPADGAFIDTGRASLRMFDLSAPGGQDAGKLIETPQPFEVLAGQIGQVFAITFGDGASDRTPPGVPNLYTGATSVYGIRIVTPDADGKPEPQGRGVPGATFMPGQFGEESGGGPGTIWRIDGVSGAVSNFADIDTNSGPGIGDVAFDAAHRQFFASDLDDGLIRRIDASGTVLDSFDHGVAGRPAGGLAAVADDGSRMDIQDAAFDTGNPTSWGYTQDERRVWAVAVQGGRIYYAVGDRGEIWSIGIGDKGDFTGDAHREFVVGANAPVTDIAFAGGGDMYLARRSRAVTAASDKAEVLRYRRENSGGAWAQVPRSISASTDVDGVQAAGGVALQYGFDAQGRIDRAACSGTVAASSDQLKTAGAAGPAFAGVRMAASGEGRIVEDSRAWFVRFDGAGQVGDVEAWNPCAGTDMAAASSQPDAGAANAAPADGGSAAAPAAEGAPRLLQVEQTGDTRCRTGQPCTFVVEITNPGPEPVEGPIRFGDAIAVDGIGRLDGVSVTSIEPPLGCKPAPSKLPLSCAGGSGLGGGGSSTHKLTVVIAASALGGAASPVAAQNCFAAVPPDTTVAGLGGGASAPGGPGGSGPYACHRFTIEIPKGGGQCKLLPGQIRTKAGRCICPSGTSLAGGKCVQAKQPACKVSGQVRGKNGACACPRGTQAVRGACRKPPQACPAGTALVGGRCVPRGGCIAGEIFVNGQCMIVEPSCPRGTAGKYPNCRPIPRLLHVPSDRSDRPDRPDRPGRDPSGGGGSTPGGNSSGGGTQGGSSTGGGTPGGPSRP